MLRFRMNCFVTIHSRIDNMRFQTGMQLQLIRRLKENNFFCIFIVTHKGEDLKLTQEIAEVQIT